jgi:hypothetical protein
MLDANGNVVPGTLKAVSSAFSGLIVIGGSLGAAKTFAGSFLSIRLQDENPSEFLKLWRELFAKDLAGGNLGVYLNDIAKQDPVGALAQLMVRKDVAQPSVVFATGKTVSPEAAITENFLNKAEVLVLLEEEGGVTAKDFQKILDTVKAIKPVDKNDIMNRIVFVKAPAHKSTAEMINDMAVLDNEFILAGKAVTLRNLWKSRVPRFAASSDQLASHRSATADSETIAAIQKINPGSALTFVAVPQLAVKVQDEGAYRFLNYGAVSTLAYYGDFDKLPEPLKRRLARNQANQLVLSESALGEYLSGLSKAFQGLQATLKAA